MVNSSCLKSDERGATAIEYALIVALVSVALIGGAIQLGGSLDLLFSSVFEKVAAAEDAMHRCEEVDSNCKK